MLDEFVDGHFDLVVSAIVVLLVAAGGFISNQRRERREFTQNLLGKVLDEEHLANADYIIHKLMMDNPGTQEAPGVCSESVKELSDELRKAIRIELNHYQQIAISYRRGILDRKLVLSVRAVHIHRMYLFFQDYVEQMRRDLDRPALYAELEAFALEDCALHDTVRQGQALAR